MGPRIRGLTSSFQRVELSGLSLVLGAPVFFWIPMFLVPRDPPPVGRAPHPPPWVPAGPPPGLKKEACPPSLPLARQPHPHLSMTSPVLSTHCSSLSVLLPPEILSHAHCVTHRSQKQRICLCLSFCPLCLWVRWWVFLYRNPKHIF